MKPTNLKPLRSAIVVPAVRTNSLNTSEQALFERGEAEHVAFPLDPQAA